MLGHLALTGFASQRGLSLLVAVERCQDAGSQVWRAPAIDELQQSVQVHVVGCHLEGGFIVESGATKARLSPGYEIKWCEKVGFAVVAHDHSATSAGYFLPPP